MNRLKELREERKMTQAELSERLGIAQATLCNYENGRRDFSTDMLLKITYIFNCTIDYLLGNSDFRYLSVKEELVKYGFNGEISEKNMKKIAEIAKLVVENDSKNEEDENG